MRDKICKKMILKILKKNKSVTSSQIVEIIKNDKTYYDHPRISVPTAKEVGGMLRDMGTYEVKLLSTFCGCGNTRVWSYNGDLK